MNGRKLHTNIEGVESKHCYNCDKWKTLDKYHKHKNMWDKLDRRCIDCVKQYRIDNKEFLNNNAKNKYQEKKKKKIKLREEKIKKDLFGYEYKNVENYKGYVATKCGKVYSLKRQKWLSQQIRNDGYINISMCNNGLVKLNLAHRIIAKTFIENLNNYGIVNHIDENKQNNNVNNLEWVLQKENLSKYWSTKPKYNINIVDLKTEKELNLDDFYKLKNQVLDNYLIDKNGNIYSKYKKRLLKSVDKNGYLRINIKRRNYGINRLVAETFIENPNNYEIVNHIDCNKHNNNVENLEWCSRIMNAQHAVINNLLKKNKRKIKQINLKTNEIKFFNSIKETSEYHKVHRNCIYDVCVGNRNSLKGFKFLYN